MNNRNRDSNPWNKNRAQINKQKAPNPSELKFKKAQEKLQIAVQKHVKDYESSSEEEDLESDNIIVEIVKNYKKSGGIDDCLNRTKTFLQDAFLAGTATCLICISRIKRESSIWDCQECYCIFHLTCIQRWSKDSIFQQKQTQENHCDKWGCPKCRHDYKLKDIPEKYYCFCRKTLEPKFQPFLVPHSCGEICKKDLRPLCGHKCLLLCHPGPCPPCPVTVTFNCYCGAEAATQRCNNKEWSCGRRCGKLLTCQKHTCSENCHRGECNPCGKKSLQKCCCQSSHKLRDCATPIWQCDKVCGKLLECGNHNCAIVCHEGLCPPCPLTETRSCPCGKSKYQLPCTEETPTCLDTCEKLLDCGEHKCNQRCHKDACGLCLEIVVKFCKCRLHSKEIQCYKSYTCETKCKRMKDCNKHPCNKKCCDGNCPPCEKPCGRTLNCGNHKCGSVCHRGLCYPCNQTDIVTCRCGATTLEVPCGRKHRTKPPKCNKLCTVPPDCHHEKREPHKCHFGDCPPCKQICKKIHETCTHLCPARCHSAVIVKVEGEKPSMPWEQTKPQLEKRNFACPPCLVPLPITCLGGHETREWPCHQAKPSSCLRPCGRLLACTNHSCTYPCHVMMEECEICENPCSKPRPVGCQHECPKPCHPGLCPPCKQMQRIRCHCGLTQLYVTCSDWLVLEKREQLQSCTNQCPKNYDCGHRCRANCHSGICPNADLCKRKVKMNCKCKRIKKEFSCEVVRNGNAKVECDDVCKLKREEERKKLEKINEEKRKQEEIKNQTELAKYKKMFEGKKKTRDRKIYEEQEDDFFFRKYWFFIATGVTVFISAVAFTFYK